MTEGVATDNDAAASRAAEQARLRKERREAKIKAGGSARLNKINGMGGRIVGDHDEPASSPSSPSPALAAATAAASAARRASATSQQPHAADPDEVDISDHFYTPASNRRPQGAPPSPFGAEGGLSEAQLRQMMLGLDRGNTPGGQLTPSGGPGTPGAEDPMMKMMSQMMAGAGAGGAPGGPDANPFAGMMPPQQASSGPDLYTTLWRILHALVALGLGLYIVLMTPFTGTKAQRELAYAGEVSSAEKTAAAGGELLWAELEQHKKNFFWAFATAEAVLLTTRFFLDNGRAPPSGFIWTILGHLPDPWRGYISSVVRYGQIFTTVRSDILLCVFVLGACSWYKTIAA